ncbi:MAG: methionine synthase, partial [Phototrophicales bacterium]
PELFRLSWGAGNTHGDAWTALQAEFEARLERMARAASRAKSLQPQAVYGFFPVNRDGDDLIIYDPAPFQSGENARVEIARFNFPRQPFGEHLCISDYFASVDSAQIDVMPLQIVTVGEVATQAFDALQAADNYTEAYFFHGLAVQAAEATANYVHQTVIRPALGIGADQGKRYSWGYPACPDLSAHETVLRLLPNAAELGLTLSPAYQWIPEQSTAAIVVHHPDAKYYSVGVDRVEQIAEA